MKRNFALLFVTVLAAGMASAADGLYYIGTEAQHTTPLKWAVGMDFSYDDNVTPGTAVTDSAFSVNPYVGLSFVNMTPQTTWDVYTRLGAVYYFDKPSTMNDSTYPQIRTGINLTHRFDERLRFSSRSFIAYELEPNYAYGFATSRQVGNYFFWETDNALGYRWSERLATYTGLTLTGLSYPDMKNQDRFTWTLYNQFRFQITPQQTVMTLDYRYGQTAANDFASDSTDQYVLLGVEHRFSPNTILVARGGLQLRTVDLGSNSSNPFLELAINSQINENFNIKGFVRYSVEGYDTVQQVDAGLYDFSQRQTLRIGLSAEYKISPMFSIFGGADYIPANFNDGKLVSPLVGPPLTVSGMSESLVNVCLGLTVKFTDYLYGSLSYNYTDSTADFINQTYNRSRITVGLRCEF